ncbi:MAG: ABC transporter permease [bacterium]|nr:ABC transporter permease [bacterium]
MIELKNITKTYETGELPFNALDNVSLKISEGDFVAIMGPSGSGKSTLLNILGCLDTPTTGSYLLSGQDVSKFSDDELAETRNKRIGFIFQHFNLLPRLNALENVKLPLIYGSVSSGRDEKAIECLKAVNLSSKAFNKPNEMSGGEQQRVAIARALVNDPFILLADEPTGNLDSKTGKEIIEIISELNKKGITIILITHDEKVGSAARRIVKIQDGQILEDKEVPKDGKEQKTNLSVTKKDYKKPSFSSPLNRIKESLSMSLSSLVATKLRSFLTMLGIIIGVGSVIMMIALGQGASSQVTDRIKSMGSNLLIISPGAANQGGIRQGGGSSVTLVNEDVEAIKRNCFSALKVCPSFSRGATVVYKNQNNSTTVEGTTADYPEINNFQVETGSFITDKDNKLMRKVAVLGKTVRTGLFGDENPIGQYIKINRINFEIVGTMVSKGQNQGFHDPDDIVFVPLATAQKRLFGLEHPNRLSRIYVQARAEAFINSAMSEITTLLRARHKVKKSDPDDFRIFSQEEILSTVQETSKTFTMLLAGIAIVSLLVGGIGIMNIMLVSVAERTREIGIRKAIGGKRRDILSQFLIEALILSLMGGIIGILLGSVVSKMASKLANWPTVISPTSVVLAFSFAFVIGIFFGIYPANKASRLKPIEALRYE